MPGVCRPDARFRGLLPRLWPLDADRITSQAETGQSPREFLRRFGVRIVPPRACVSLSRPLPEKSVCALSLDTVCPVLACVCSVSSCCQSGLPWPALYPDSRPFTCGSPCCGCCLSRSVHMDRSPGQSFSGGEICASIDRQSVRTIFRRSVSPSQSKLAIALTLVF